MKHFILFVFLFFSLGILSQNKTIYQLYEVENPPVMFGYKIQDSISLQENFKKSIFDFVQNNVSIITGSKTSTEKAFVEIVIDEKGKFEITNSKATNKKAHREALKTIKKMPDFTTASFNGKSVKMRFTIPITFNILVF